MTQTTRSWSDRSGLGVDNDYVPQCDLMNPALNGECGPWLDQSFLKTRPTTTLDPSLVSGWGVRPSDWQFGVSVQREILPRTSVEVGYYRRWWQHFTDATDNILTQASDYQQYFPHGAGRSTPAGWRRLQRRSVLRHQPGDRARRPEQQRHQAGRGRRHLQAIRRLRGHQRVGENAQRIDAAGRHEHRTDSDQHLRHPIRVAGIHIDHRRIDDAERRLL